MKRSVLRAALLAGIGCSLRLSAQTAPVTAKLGEVSPAPTFIVYVGGAISHAGKIHAADATLADVFALAGGWKRNADLSQVRITRREKVNGKDKTTTQIVNFDDYVNIKNGKIPDEANNPIIKDKDRIFIGYKVSKKAAPHAAPKR